MTTIGVMVVLSAGVRAESSRVTAVVLRHWPPQYQLGDRGQPTGFAIDVMEQVATAAGLEVSYKVVDVWEEAFDALKSGQVDLIPNQGITNARKKWFAFTSPVETFPVVIFVRQSNTDINASADLSGHVVAAVRYNVGARLIHQFSNVDQRIFLTLNEAFLELLAGHVDALIYPRPVLLKLAMEAGLENRIKVVGPPLVEIKRGISVRKDNKALLARLEPAVKKFVLSKEYKHIYAHWYGRPNPFWTPRRVVLSMTGLVFVLALWHSLRMTKVNRRLKQSIRDQKKAETALRAGEEKYRLIVENQSDLTIKLDAEGKLLFASPSFCHTFGISARRLTGNRFLSLVHWQDREKVHLAMQSLHAAPHVCRHEERALTPKGWQWFSWSNKAVLDATGRILEIIAVGRNTTERKQAEVKLRESEERFRAIFEQAADAVVLLNMQTLAIVEFNAAAHQSLGYPHEAFNCLSLIDLVVPNSGEDGHKAVERIIKAGRRHPVEVRLRSKTGQVRHFLMKQRPLSVNNGQYLLGIWHDITERKMLEEHLVQSQKMEAIGTLAGGVAHDFNNILSIMIGNTELALHDFHKRHPVVKRLKEILIAGTRAKEVVRQLLTFSRKEKAHRVPMALIPLVEESLQLLRASIPTTVHIQKHIYDQNMTLLADATQIHQVLINLCTNAAQAMVVDGGIIDVTVLSMELDPRTARRYHIAPGVYARICIEDTGDGIAPEIMERIFEPYFTTKKTSGGTGMGLSIVHGIITRNNGAIDVESEPGRGTVFKILLPLTEKAPDIEKMVVEQDSAGKERILLVDDEPAIVALGKEYLRKLGYDPQGFTSASEAFAAFEANPMGFDLVITDRTMPEMTGEMLIEEMFKIRPKMPIVLCSGYQSKVCGEHVNVIGINFFLQKPYTMKALSETVRKALAEKVGT